MYNRRPRQRLLPSLRFCRRHVAAVRAGLGWDGSYFDGVWAHSDLTDAGQGTATASVPNFEWSSARLPRLVAASASWSGNGNGKLTKWTKYQIRLRQVLLSVKYYLVHILIDWHITQEPQEIILITIAR